MSAFTFVLPPTWTRIDLTGDVPTAINAAVTPFVRAAPLSRQPALRRMLTEQVEPSLTALATNGTVCAVVALNPYDRSPIRPTMTFRPVAAELWAAVPDGTDPRAVLAAIAEQDADADLVRIDELIGLRTTSSADPTDRYLALVDAHYDELVQTAAAPSEGDGEMAAATDLVTTALMERQSAEFRMRTVRVHYLLADPADRARWISIGFSADHLDSPAADDLSAATVGLFDAMVSTFRWAA